MDLFTLQHQFQVDLDESVCDEENSPILSTPIISSSSILGSPSSVPLLPGISLSSILPLPTTQIHLQNHEQHQPQLVSLQPGQPPLLSTLNLLPLYQTRQVLPTNVVRFSFKPQLGQQLLQVGSLEQSLGVLGQMRPLQPICNQSQTYHQNNPVDIQLNPLLNNPLHQPEQQEQQSHLIYLPCPPHSNTGKPRVQEQTPLKQHQSPQHQKLSCTGRAQRFKVEHPCRSTEGVLQPANYLANGLILLPPIFTIASSSNVSTSLAYTNVPTMSISNPISSFRPPFSRSDESNIVTITPCTSRLPKEVLKPSSITLGASATLEKDLNISDFIKYRSPSLLLPSRQSVTFSSSPSEIISESANKENIPTTKAMVSINDKSICFFICLSPLLLLWQFKA
ncbi:unnamed protein product [Protopolystoma xenopodis]|uniref:Uncharacterized protein n=1 Tax=Protopolystoma xenopodis TaxID=117903 RepID=A0A448X0M8_9PLAT|nr:unnamed protein product [Protopolystoma xenopodis]